MRRTVTVLATVVSLALITGCSSSPEQVAGAAEPVGGVTPGSSSSTATVEATTTAPSTGATATPGGADETRGVPEVTQPPGKLVLGPDGLGALKLGMTQAKAVKTGLLAKDGETEGQGCNTAYKPKAAGKADAPVFFSNLGLVSITAYPGVATPQGIKLGSKKSAVEKAYPDLEILTGPESDGRGWAKVPGNTKALFNITIADGQVSHMNLQLRTQNCYE